MYKKFMVVVLVLAFALTASAAFAAEPSGTISIRLTSASAVLGASWGEGVLTFGAKTYSFKVKGLKVLSVGLTKASANGDVYKLTNPEDLAGTYKEASRAGLTFIKGEKGIVVQNDKGVVINVKSTAKGLGLGLVEGGLTIEDVK
jgi:P pilus assembly chaperone PapD